MSNQVANLQPMNIYNCVWCGCVLGYKEDVCFEHTRNLKVLRAHIEAALNDDIRERRVHQHKVVVDSVVLSRKIKEQIEIEAALKEAERNVNLMSDEEQQHIFRALGIAV